MEFDWNNPPFNLNISLSIKDIEESFEDPFAVRLLPDSSRFAVQSRSFNLVMSANGMGAFSLYRTNAKSVRIIFPRMVEARERFLYTPKLYQAPTNQTHP